MKAIFEGGSQEAAAPCPLPQTPSPNPFSVLDRARLRSQTDGELFFEVVGVVGEFGFS